MYAQKPGTNAFFMLIGIFSAKVRMVCPVDIDAFAFSTLFPVFCTVIVSTNALCLYGQFSCIFALLSPTVCTKNSVYINAY